MDTPTLSEYKMMLRYMHEPTRVYPGLHPRMREVASHFEHLPLQERVQVLEQVASGSYQELWRKVKPVRTPTTEMWRAIHVHAFGTEYNPPAAWWKRKAKALKQVLFGK